MINLKEIKENNLPLKSLFVISIVANLILVGIGLLSNLILPPEIPLFYGLPKSDEQLAKNIFIVLPAIISIAITIMNAAISFKVNSLYLKKALAITSVCITLLSIIATVKIILLVGSI